jgi:uncharacterized membrane protein (DUF373 family)
MMPPAGNRMQSFRDNWLTLNLYERFEQVVALVITVLIAAIIVLAVFKLTREVIVLLWTGALDPLDYRVFQAIFGQIMIVLIALEFKHSIIRVVAYRESIIQVRTVLLIALLAISRKFIVLDADQYAPSTIFALAAVVLALGGAYWLVRDRDEKRLPL